MDVKRSFPLSVEWVTSGMLSCTVGKESQLVLKRIGLRKGTRLEHAMVGPFLEGESCSKVITRRTFTNKVGQLFQFSRVVEHARIAVVVVVSGDGTKSVRVGNL